MFDVLTKTNRFALYHRLNAVKKAETRERKIREFVAMLARHEAPYPRRPAPSKVPGMTKWEYLTAPILTHAAKQILDNFGADGWELVQIAPGMNPENLVGYFKRPLAS